VRGRKPRHPNSKKNQPYTYERGWNYVLWLLSQKAYTEAELRRKLVRKQVDEADVDRILDKLRGYAFVDDALYAERYVRDRGKRKGEIALRQELRRKGIAESDVHNALEPLDDDAQLEAATALLDKHAWRFHRGDPPKDRTRAFAFLARRGYGSDVARAALERSGIGRSDEER
jgi:regulatory protein